MNSRQAQISCVVLTIAFLLAAWWPFAPFPHNAVAWSKDRAGLSFAPPGIAYDAERLPMPSDKPGSGIAIELALEPGMEPRNRISHILSIYDGRRLSRLAIVQWKSNLLVRVPAPGNPNEFREVGLVALRTGESHVITISSDSTATTFYVDGRLSLRANGFVMGPDTMRGQLLLGNAPTGKSSWSGRLFGVAIFNRSLNAKEAAAHQQMWAQGTAFQLGRESRLVALYTFAEGSGQQARDTSPARHTLLIPSRYVVLQKTVLESPGSAVPRDWYAKKDVLLNIVGFVPFGFFALLSHRSPPPARWLHPLLTATLAGAAVSLIIELGQVWLPSRDSSIRDLACNTAGTAIGVFLAWMVISRRQRQASSV